MKTTGPGQSLRSLAAALAIAVAFLPLNSPAKLDASLRAGTPLAALDPCSNEDTTPGRDRCLGKQIDSLSQTLEIDARDVEYGFRNRGLDPTPFLVSQASWKATRDLTCDALSEPYIGGTIESVHWDYCTIRFITARINRLATSYPHAHDSQRKWTPPPRQAANPNAATEVDRVYALFLEHNSAFGHSMLAAAQRAWVTYRNQACQIEAGDCLTELDKERVADLEAGWLGDAFW